MVMVMNDLIIRGLDFAVSRASVFRLHPKQGEELAEDLCP